MCVGFNTVLNQSKLKPVESWKFSFQFACFGFQSYFSNLQVSNPPLITSVAIIEEMDFNCNFNSTYSFTNRNYCKMTNIPVSQ